LHESGRHGRSDALRSGSRRRPPIDTATAWRTVGDDAVRSADPPFGGIWRVPGVDN